jgi:hypothetical protein
MRGFYRATHLLKDFRESSWIVVSNFLSIYLITNLFPFWGVLEFEFWALCLLGRHSATWAASSTLFALVIFLISWSDFICTGLDCHPPFYITCITVTSCFYHHIWLILLRLGLINFCLDCAGSVTLPMSAHRVLGFTGVIHHAQDFAIFLPGEIIVLGIYL